jgi:hypothetical protein
MNEASESPVSYAQDIRPLFRERDIDSMRRARQLDLASHAEVVAHADDILNRLETGDMPCDGSWPAANVDLFRRWIDQGKQP